MDSGDAWSETLVDAADALLLRAISHTGPDAVAAFRQWRAGTTIEDANNRSRRILPLLADVLRREGVEDPDLTRIAGVARHIWTQNTLNERLLLEALDALAADGIQPMLLKGVALFARSREFMSKRLSSDGDILVRPGELERAAAALRARGFRPKDRHWEDFAAPLIDSDTSGTAIGHAAHTRDVDLHWRPLWNLYDRGLHETLFAGAETLQMHSRSVLVPSATHQLFLALARCEPWDEDESFARLIEARLLLSMPTTRIDWAELLRLIGQYHLEIVARAFLGDLSRYAGLMVPEEVRTHLAAERSPDRLAEWEIRRVSPERRSERQRWALQGMDAPRHRDRPGPGLPSEREIELREIGLDRMTGLDLWRGLRSRLRSGGVDDIQFLEGFGPPEMDGRWSFGHWSAIAIPLSAREQAGEPVSINAHALIGKVPRARVVAYGGHEIADRVQWRGQARADLSLRVEPVPELNGGGLILLWLPNAHTPKSDGDSNDARELGLHIHRQWRAPRRNPSLRSALRTMYRRLPLRDRARDVVAPILRKIEAAIAVRLVPPPLPLRAIEPGDVVLSGYLSDLSGIGRAGRLTRLALADWGAPVTAHDMRTDMSAANVPDVRRGGVWICHCNAPEAIAVLLSRTERLWAGRYRIAVWVYELQSLPPDWGRALRHFHEIWAPSQFVADAIARSAGAGGPLIKVVPHPLPPLPLPKPRESPSRPFRFLSMFDTRSSASRKNPMGAIAAFKRAFEPGTREATLVVKMLHSEADSAALRDLKAAIEGWPCISLLTRHFGDTETVKLIEGADCLVSLHRSEGFGLTVAEAMCVGTPSIITGWSAPVEFSKGAAIEIDYRLIPVADSSGLYGGAGQVWADPDLDHAAREMRRLVGDRYQWAALSSAGIELARDRLQRPVSSADYRRFLVKGELPPQP